MRQSRMRPILISAIASLAGFLPLVIATTTGANSRQSLGPVIFGGLLVAIQCLEGRWFGEGGGPGRDSTTITTGT
jgi:HAE1 family hydrophobic/amphiphilic exporter-1